MSATVAICVVSYAVGALAGGLALLTEDDVHYKWPFEARCVVVAFWPLMIVHAAARGVRVLAVGVRQIIGMTRKPRVDVPEARTVRK